MATPLAGKQAPGVYRLKVGAFEVTVISDGNLAIDRPMFAGDTAGADKLLAAAFMPKGAIPTCVNEWLVNTGGKLVLVDAGGGAFVRPDPWKNARQSRRRGRRSGTRSMSSSSPTCIRTTSRACSVRTARWRFRMRSCTFRRRVRVLDVGRNSRQGAGRIQGVLRLARTAIKPYADAGKVQMFKDGTTLAPGITAAAMPGHTVGHSMVRVSSGGMIF